MRSWIAVLIVVAFPRDVRARGEPAGARHRQRRLPAHRGIAKGESRREELCRPAAGKRLFRSGRIRSRLPGHAGRGRAIHRQNPARRHGRVRLFRPWLERRFDQLRRRRRRAGRCRPGIAGPRLAADPQRPHRRAGRFRAQGSRPQSGDHRRLPRQPVSSAARPEGLWPLARTEAAIGRGQLRDLFRRRRPDRDGSDCPKRMPIPTACSRARCCRCSAPTCR